MRLLIVLMLLLAAPLHCAEVTDEQMEAALKTWRAYDMPEPPAEAKLVRLGSTGASYVNGVRQPPDYWLAFRLGDQEGQKRYFVGAWIDVDPYGVKEAAVEEPDTLDSESIEVPSFGRNSFDINNAFGLGLCLWARGHKNLGRMITGRALDVSVGHHFSSFYQPAADSPAKMLPAVMWARWANLLVEPKTDRKKIYEQMEKAYEEFDVLHLDWGGQDFNKNILDMLKETTTLRDVKAGTVEADIDALVEVCQKAGTLGGSHDKPDPLYIAVLQHGFDAVPALIAHLDDNRLTRSVMVGFNNFASYIRRVGELAGDILQAIAGKEMGRDWLSRQKGWSIDKEVATKWWEQAQKVGEEKYLKDNMIDKDGTLNSDTLYLVAAKYPRVLLDKFLAALKAGEHPPSALTYKLAESSLDPKEKASAFAEGAKAEDLDTRWESVRCLQEYDQEAYVNVVVETLDSFGEKKSDSQFWTTPEARWTHLVVRTGDQRAWDALECAAKRAEVGLRMMYLNPMNYSYIGDDYKEQRLKLLASFINDTTVQDSSGDGYDGPHAAFLWDKIAVRDFVCNLIGSILNVNASPEPEWTEKEWAPFRASVLKALKEFGIEPPENK